MWGFSSLPDIIAHLNHLNTCKSGILSLLSLYLVYLLSSLLPINLHFIVYFNIGTQFQVNITSLSKTIDVSIPESKTVYDLKCMIEDIEGFYFLNVLLFLILFCRNTS